jgi:O-glycosyl hydrolase
MKKKRLFVILGIFLGFFNQNKYLLAQSMDFTSVSVTVDFSEKLQEWDGFGVNYVQATHTTDYEKDPQDNGGFYRLSEDERYEIAELVFGYGGWRVNLVKMFLDPLHQKIRGGVFDHKTSTTYMREFVRNGVELSKKRGEELSVITTLFCPPGYTTKQKFLRGRDLAPEYKNDVANYMIDWVNYLRNEEKFPVNYVSLHNEGEDWQRWPADGSESYLDLGHDYNMFWPKEQVIDFLIFMRPLLDEAGLQDVGLTPGETTYWSKFYTTGYANAIFENKQALKNLGLITSHGFYGHNLDQRWFGGPTNLGTQLLQSERPELHAWSTSLYFMDGIVFFKTLHMQVYQAKVNGIIPWAFTKDIGTYDKTAKPIDITEEGSYKITPVYYLYKHLTRAGQKGMSVAETFSMDTEILVFGFSGNKTGNRDAIVIANNHDFPWKVLIEVYGIKNEKFRAYRSNEGKIDKLNPNVSWDKYKDIGTYVMNNGRILIELPSKSVVTLFAEK